MQGISWKDELSQEDVLIAGRISNLLYQLIRNEDTEQDGFKVPLRL